MGKTEEEKTDAMINLLGALKAKGGAFLNE